MNLTQDTQNAINIATAIAKEHMQQTISPAHILQGIMHNEIGLAATLATWQKDIHYIREWADLRIEKTPKSSSLDGDPNMDSTARKVLEFADMQRMKLGQDLVSPEAILAALCRPDIAFTSDQLKSLPLTEEEVLKNLVGEIDTTSNGSAHTSSNGSAISANKTTQALEKYCVDKTAMARDGLLDPIIGRDKEIRIMTEILGRRIKPNPIILGDPGVGKTALVDGFAQLIVAGQVPDSLKEAKLLELDSGSLIAGASYKGEIEDRIKKIVNEIKAKDKAILFIDEIHMLLDPNAGFGGAANLLKPELARGELTVIGATTIKEYREFIENDPAFSRRFDKVVVEEPDVQSAIRMVQHLAGKYEDHHALTLGKETASESVTLAKRYVSDKSLPDSAFDLIDGTMSAIHMMTETSVDEIDGLMEEISNMDDDASMEDFRWLEVQMNNRLSPILIGKIEAKEADAISTTAEYKSWLNNTLGLLKMEASESNTIVEPSDVAAIIANKTNIPIGKLQENQRDKYLRIEDKLRQRVVGQDGALRVVSEAILESRAGLKKAGKPVGSFFFTGPTGTGKTELAKSLAEFLFNDDTALIRFDMSEFKESVSAALLYGASPGYVGYKEGGLLVNKIREKPYSIVLFDEIEKAHESVFDVFLQILDEGRLTDKQGRQGDFSNAVILFTSNLGQEHVVDYLEKNNALPSSDEIREIYLNDRSIKFRPEFLARMDAIVPFAPISEEVVQLIFNIQLKDLVKLLQKQGISFAITEEAEKHLAFEGYSPKFGARPIRNVIKKRLRQPLSRLIINQSLKEGQQVTVKMEDDDVKFDII